MTVYTLLGHPLGHSLSPAVHRLLAQTHGRKMDYRLTDLAPEELDAYFPSMLREGGLNVTIPYKQAVIPYLRTLDESAARYGAVNTIVCGAQGATGYNTDCIGFLRTLGDAADTVHRAAVIGAGGAGRMFAIELARRGAHVDIGVRETSLERGHALAREIGAHARVLLLDKLNMSGGSYDLLVNASPCGMFPQVDACPASETLVRGSRMIFDSIYNPQETRLLQMARALGVKAVGGLRMLVWQAAAAQEIWFGTHFSQDQVDQVEASLYKLMSKENQA